MKQLLRFAYTPDPDDAFHYFALETGKLDIPGNLDLQFEHRHIRDLNESCRDGLFDVCAISSVFYPNIDTDYVILGSGASVGRGYGPVLACRSDRSMSSLEDTRVGVPGFSTTGYFLLRYFYSGFEAVNLAFNEIEDAIVQGEIDAGVLIHEELLNYTERPIRKICCLGNRWFKKTGLPLPVGLNVARRALGAETILVIENLLHESMFYAIEHPDDAMAYASDFGRGSGSAVRQEFVNKFANGDTLLMPDDVRKGLVELYRCAFARHLIDHQPTLDLVDPVLS